MSVGPCHQSSYLTLSKMMLSYSSEVTLDEGLQLALCELED